jgi:hypothetical protein
MDTTLLEPHERKLCNSSLSAPNTLPVKQQRQGKTAVDRSDPPKILLRRAVYAKFMKPRLSAYVSKVGRSLQYLMSNAALSLEMWSEPIL